MSHLPQAPKSQNHENNNGGLMDNTTSNDTSQSNSGNSFVGKVRSTLSKWFATTPSRSSQVVRPRSEMEADDSSNNDSDDDSEDQLQSKLVLPPAKRLKTTTTDEVFGARVNNSVNNTQLRLFSQVGARNPKRLVLNRRNNFSLVQQTPDSDSGESTSGYSSMPRLPQANKLEETEPAQAEDRSEKASTSAELAISSTIINLHNRSLFDTSHDRSLFNLQSIVTNTSIPTCGNSVIRGTRPASLSTRRPAFSGANLTTTNNNTLNTTLNKSNTSNNSGGLLDRTIATRRIYNSPFYSGRTLYGGSSNATIGPLLLSQQSPRLNSNLAIRDNDNTSSTMLSSTARRILDTLESYTLDSTQQKNLINQSSNRRQLKQDHLFNRSNKPYNRQNQRKLEELQVPNVAQLLKMKERLQNQTVQVRQMIKESNQQQQTAASSGGKMRTKVTAHVRQHKQHHVEQQIIDDDNSEEVERLSSIQLPISALPQFTDLNLPLPQSSRTGTAFGTVDKTATAIVKTATSNNATMVSQFKCSNVAKSTNITLPFSANQTTTTPVAPSFNITPPPVTNTPAVKAPQKSDEQVFVFAKPLVLLDSGLNGSKLRNITAINNFKFSVPLNQKLIHKMNQQKCNPDTVDFSKTAETITVAASSTEQDKSKLPPTDFGASFKLTSNAQWECDVCLVRNPNTALNCLACTSPKTIAAKATSTSTKDNTGWSGTIFKPPSNKWECQVCLVSNSNDKVSCVACETPKLGAVNSATKTAAPSGSSAATWECPTCMVKNQASAQSCVCCETLKIGSKISSSDLKNSGSSNLMTKFNFGITPATTAAPSVGAAVSGFTFGIPQIAAKTCVINKESVPTGYTFGIPAAVSTTTVAATTSSNSSSAVSSTTTLNQKPLPNGVISSSSNSSSNVPPPVTTTSATTLPTSQASALAEIKFGVAAAAAPAAASNLITFGRPAAAAIAAVDVSSSTSSAKTANTMIVPQTTTTTASSVTFGSSGVSSTAAAAVQSFVLPNKIAATAAPAVTSQQQQPFAFPFSNKPKEEAAQAPIFCFGPSPASSSNSTTTNNNRQSNGPFMFGGSSAVTTTTTTSAATSSLFNFGATTTTPVAPSANVTAPPSFGFGTATTSLAAFGAAAAPGSNMFGQPKMRNGGFDFTTSLGGGGGGKRFQAAAAGTSSSAGFNFAAPNAVRAPVAAATTTNAASMNSGLFSFGSSGNNSSTTGATGVNGAPTQPFTFGAVSSSSSTTDANNKPLSLLPPPPPHNSAPLSFGGITSSSAPSSVLPVSPPHHIMFGTPTHSTATVPDINNSGGGSNTGLNPSQIPQQRRIIRKAVRRTNTQPR